MTKLHAALFLGIFVSFLWLAGTSLCAADKAQITVVFRYDDYSSNESAMAFEGRLIGEFQRSGVRCTFGVIPFGSVDNFHRPSSSQTFPLRQSKADILNRAVSAGAVEVALHGYSHQANRPLGAAVSEFAGLDYYAQEQKIAIGKAALETLLGRRITTFIPPWNSYDLNTLAVLKRLRFETISADAQGDVDQNSGLKFLPQTCVLSQVRRGVESARKIHDSEPIIVVTLHPFEFIEVEKDKGCFRFEEVSNLLTWLKRQPDIQLRSFDQLTQTAGDLNAGRLLKYRSYAKLISLIPRPVYSGGRGIYLSSEVSYKMVTKARVIATLFYLGAALVSVGFGFFLSVCTRRRLAWMLPVRYGAPLLLLLDVIYQFYRIANDPSAIAGVNYRNALITVVLLGVSIGVWIYFKRAKAVNRPANRPHPQMSD